MKENTFKLHISTKIILMRDSDPLKYSPGFLRGGGGGVEGI